MLSERNCILWRIKYKLWLVLAVILLVDVEMALFVCGLAKMIGEVGYIEKYNNILKLRILSYLNQPVMI